MRAREGVCAGACARMGGGGAGMEGLGVLGACLHLCVCIHLCVECPGMQKLPVFRSLHGRGQAPASTCAQEAAWGGPTCGCPWDPPFPVRWPMGALPSPLLPGQRWCTWSTGMGQGHCKQRVEHGVWQAGAGKGAVPGGGGRSLVPFQPPQPHPSLPGGKGFLHLTKARFSLEIKSCSLCFEEKRQQQLPVPQQSR